MSLYYIHCYAVYLQFYCTEHSFLFISAQLWVQRKREVILVKEKKIVRRTFEVKKEIITKHENGAHVSDLAAEYGMAKLTISTIIKNKEVIKGADVAKRVTVISKQRPPILKEVKKLLQVYINEVQLRGDNISELFICEKAIEIYDDLVKKKPVTSDDTFEFKASRGWFENLRTEVKYTM